MIVQPQRAASLQSDAGRDENWASRLKALLATLNPPLRDRRFWAAQTLVAAIAITHDSVEMFGFLPHLGMAYFLPISLFFIPAVYAALYFGLAGSFATALWCTLLSVPNWVLWHSGSARVGVISQMLIVDAIALFVGTRVNEQMKARAEAEAASDALRTSEARYRGLFETAGEAILVLDKGDRITECNTAASLLLQKPIEGLRDQALQDVFPPDVSLALRAAIHGLDGTRNEGVRLESPDGAGIWIDPVCTPFAEQAGLTQVVLRNVTEQKRRQAGLETYSAQILKAQEEERKRVAQELHDDTVQSLLVLRRTLDDSEVGFPTDAEGLSAVLRDAHGQAESTVDALRRFARGLRPPALDDLGLGPALDRLATDVTSHSSVQARLLVQGREQRLPPDIELALFRIGQEALHNVERHSNARRVRITLSYRPEQTKLVIQDDGDGFRPPPALDDFANESKLGLLGMQERARIVGGRLRILSAPGSGTKVIAEVPALRGSLQAVGLDTPV